jgi:hypothetical protein
MIYVIRNGIVINGKMLPALAWSREIAAYSKQVTGVDWHVMVQVGGNMGKINFQSQFESLAAFEAWSAKVNVDPKWAEFFVKAADLFAEAAREEIFRTI